MSEEIEDHRLLNDSENEPFSSVLERRVSRRSIMRGGLNVAAVSMLAGFGLTACSDDDNDNRSVSEDDRAAAMMLAFEAVAGSKQDAVVVPSANASQKNGSAALTAGTAAATATSGYTAQVVMPWGTPINNNGQAWSQSLAFTPEIQANSVGMHHDGMYHFPISDDTASSNFIMALNNEYIDQGALWAPQGGPSENPRPANESRTEINAHGVTVVELRRDENRVWDVVRNSQYNRRVTSATPCDLEGPVAGSQYVVTAYDNTGRTTRGTNNNCANGFTPWGTYLTCEENWPAIFRKDSGREADDNRLGIGQGGTRYDWETSAGDATENNGEFARFNATPTGETASADYRNEPRTFGYIVEIDPYDATSRPVKRTALGRFRHEGCWPGKLVEGEPVVFYSGHDSRNEYIYKFVSDAKWNPADANMAGATTDRLAIGAKYMNEGTLYAAKFNADGTGEWLELEPDTIVPVSAGSRYAGQTLASALGLEAGDRAGIIIHTCDAADLMGATPMDRPEWGTVDPVSGEVYMTLTNNSDRLPEGQRATVSNGDSIEEPGASYGQAPVNAANPRAGNSDGQVIRWVEPSPGETTFDWDVFVFGKVPTSDDQNLSSLSEQNFFSSCDGLWYDDRGDGQGILWIETDSGTQYTNDQVLAVVPQGLSKGDNASVIHEGNQAQLKRFAVGPNGCEVTGIFATPDKTALFINIQHPSNWPIDDNGSNTPDATVEPTGDVRPRASTVVIQKADGGQIAV
ncbi:PhoX family phosphatase [Salinisphaera sp.]|uniref:PhoX family protein n=1 Tax=Salinisphaera sp. TaxID=1914330 RepID=UPI000C5B59F3|nr:PhoX family phosphatase [Salinisphaera sp.]MBS62529.1 dTDP-glucose 4,6-dehydratase [Salinisphaera sp.]